ncbi:MAG: BatA domain-containing protein [Bacteroidota bacterium]
MNFLYPGFLFALFTIAIPIIIHLFNFRRFKKVYFSNVSFLKEVKEQHSSQEKLKNLLVLLSRILAIIFLVLAFARPFLSTNSVHNRIKENNAVSIYIDNSYSMEAVNKEGTLLDEAKRKAKEIVKTFRLNDHFQLLTNDFEGKHQRLLNADEFIKAVDEVKISAAGRQLKQVINRQQSVFKGADNRFAFVISDFQNSFTGSELIKIDTGTTVSLVKLKGNDLPNVAVDSLWLLSPVHQANTTERLVVKLRNYGEEDAKNISIKLAINQQQKAIGSLNILAGKSTIDTLSYSGLNLGWQKGTIHIKDFPLTFDDELNFSFNVNSDQKILSINGVNSGKYIRALFNADPYFKLSEMSESNINYAAFPLYSLIVLNGLNNPSSGLASELKAYVKNGGTVVVFPDLDANTLVYSQFLTALDLPAVAALNTNAIKVSTIELKNPLFKGVFETLPHNMDLPEVKRYFSFAEKNTSSKENLLQLPANGLFFARYPTTGGQLFLVATGLNEKDSNLPKHPVFVPLMYKIAFSSAKEQPLYQVIAKDNTIESNKINLHVNQSLKLVADNFEIIPELRQSNGKSLLYIADQVKKAGFYDLKQGDSTIAIIAFNDNRTESDMHYTKQSDLQQIFGKQKVAFLDPKSDRMASVFAAKNNGTELWKLCLILSVIFLAIEIVLIRFYHQQNYTNS